MLSTKQLISYIIIIFLVLSGVNSLSSRNGILSATYSELLNLNANGINYFDEPLIITESIQSNWTLVNNLGNIFDKNYNISVSKQITNCSCLYETYNNYNISNNNLCQHYGKTIQYKRNHKHYRYWDKFEGKHKVSINGLINCINTKRINESVLNGFNEITQLNSLNNYNSNETESIITNTRKFFFLFGYNNEENEEIDMEINNLQLNIFDNISLFPFFNLFKTNGLSSFSDINSLNIWYAFEYYRAIRHFDKPNNLFFVLKGSRDFRISQPTSIIFEQYPFLHGSNRHPLANYPFIDKYYEGIKINDKNYKIIESTIYENEVLYLPGYWWHEVINNNITIAMNIWWESNGIKLSKQLYKKNDIQLPINPIHPYLNINTFKMHKHGINGFLYFIQNLIYKWCNYKNTIRCNSNNNNAFLLYNFISIYKNILNNLTFDNFEWYSIIIDINNILKCTKNGIVDFDDLIDLKKFIYVCNDLEQVYKKLWDKLIDDILNILYKHINEMIAETNLVEYLERMLLLAFGDSNIIPIIIKLINL